MISCRKNVLSFGVKELWEGEREREGQRDKRKHQDSHCGGARLPDGGDKWGTPGSVDHMETRLSLWVCIQQKLRGD